MTAATPAPPPLDAGLEQLLRRMRLPHMRRIPPRCSARCSPRKSPAGTDPRWPLAAPRPPSPPGRPSLPGTRTCDQSPDLTRNTGQIPVPDPTQQALRTLESISRHENLVVCGPSGTGKTFLLEALGQAAVQTGRHVAWFTLEQLGVLIRRHRADASVTKAIGRILHADLVRRHRAAPGRPGRRRRTLPPGRRRIRETKRGCELNSSPVRIR